MQLSVIVLTSPGREPLLSRCLEMLSRQSWPWFEVIVVDDGSEGGEETSKSFRNRLDLRYTGRANDGRPARSRNLGAELAHQDKLVFFDGDMLPNPLAVESYARCLEQTPEAAVYGYTGNLGKYPTRSLWFPGLAVMAYDARFIFRAADWMVCERELMQTPQRFAWGGSFALRAERFNAAGGFDERFVGWGFEDMEFAQRLLRLEGPIDFCLDAWSENQIHEQSWRLQNSTENEARLPEFTPVSQPPQIWYNPAVSGLGPLLASHYVPHMPQKPEAWVSP